MGWNGWDQSCKSGRVRACKPKFLYNIGSNDSFLSLSTFVVLTAVTSVSEVFMIFLQLILFANTAAFFCSLLGLVSYSFSEATAVRKLARDGSASKRSITYAILRLCSDAMAYNPAFNPVALS